MISSAIWDKSARVNFSKSNQFVVFEKFTSAALSQIAREKSCDYLLIIHIQYCAKVMITIIDENRDNRELSAIFERYFD